MFFYLFYNKLRTYESVLAEAETLVLSQKDISEIGNDIDKIYEKPIMRQLVFL